MSFQWRKSIAVSYRLHARKLFCVLVPHGMQLVPLFFCLFVFSLTAWVCHCAGATVFNFSCVKLLYPFPIAFDLVRFSITEIPLLTLKLCPLQAVFICEMTVPCTFTYGCQEARRTGIRQPIWLRQACEEKVDRRSPWRDDSTVSQIGITTSLSNPARDLQRSLQADEHMIEDS